MSDALREAVVFLLDTLTFGEPPVREGHVCGPEGACDGQCMDRAHYQERLKAVRLGLGLDPYRPVSTAGAAEWGCEARRKLGIARGLMISILRGEDWSHEEAQRVLEETADESNCAGDLEAAKANLTRFITAYESMRRRFGDEYEVRFAECDDLVKKHDAAAAPRVLRLMVVDLMRRMEATAREWLIENNHHACHRSMDKNAPIPREDDVRYLSNLLLRMYCEGREEGRKPSA